jgi:hypothetical protein
VAFPAGATPSTSSAEYRANWGVGGVKAEAGWTRGATGAGVVVAIIDDGIIPSEPEIAGRLHPASMDIVDTRNQLTGAGTHGTELAGFIAGAFNGVSTVGVAYDATILAVRADDPNCTSANCSFLNSDLARAVDYAAAQGAKIINLSLGSAGVSSQAFRAALARATAAGVIVVNSAGNDGPTAPDVNYPGRFASDLTVSNGLILTVGAIGPSGALAAFSNIAGPSQNWYVVAPGDQVFTVDSGAPGATDPAFQTCFEDFTCRMQGTSYSAPHVVGALALLRQAFPALSPQQLVQLLLRSADDRGDPGVDAIWGRGQVNVERAFAPIGPLSAPLAGAAGSAAVGANLGATGPAFGNAFARPGVWTTVAFDDFGRTFSVDLGRGWRAVDAPGVADAAAPLLWRSASDRHGFSYTVSAGEAQHPFGAREAMRRDERRDASSGAFRIEAPLAPGWSVAVSGRTPALIGRLGLLGEGVSRLAASGSSLAVQRQAGRLGTFALATQSGGAPPWAGAAAGKTDATIAKWLFARGPVEFGLARADVRERGRALGLALAQRAGAAMDARTVAHEVTVALAPTPRLRLEARGETGTARIAGGPAWLQAAGDLATSAGRVTLSYQLAAARHVAGLATLTLSQPLRVEAGGFTALLPDSDAWGRAHLRMVERSISAVPDGRELELRAGYTAWSGDRLAADAAIAVRRDPGHQAGAPAEAYARIGLRVAF